MDPDPDIINPDPHHWIRQLRGRPSLFVFKFVLNNNRRDISPTNRIAFGDSSSLIGRYLAKRLGLSWSTVTKFVGEFSFQRSMCRNVEKVDLAASVLIYIDVYHGDLSENLES